MVEHTRPARTDYPNWRWADLWEQENPSPYHLEGYTEDDWDGWTEPRDMLVRRTWVAYCLPQFRVWDWSQQDVDTAYELVSHHVCPTCGRADDPGCWENC